MQRDQFARQVEIEIVDVHSLTAGDGAPTRLSSIESAGRRDFCYNFEVNSERRR
jgi:type IV pilus biogenesis protein CpaD/CtpE